MDIIGIIALNHSIMDLYTFSITCINCPPARYFSGSYVVCHDIDFFFFRKFVTDIKWTVIILYAFTVTGLFML